MVGVTSALHSRVSGSQTMGCRGSGGLQAAQHRSLALAPPLHKEGHMHFEGARFVQICESSLHTYQSSSEELTFLN